MPRQLHGNLLERGMPALLPFILLVQNLVVISADKNEASFSAGPESSSEDNEPVSCLFSTAGNKSNVCFLPCNKKCAHNIQKQGNIYLSCFFNICSGSSTTRGYFPYATVGQSSNRSHSLQIGIDVHVNGNVSTKRRGIGITGNSVVTFHLDAFRQNGLAFTHFVANTKGTRKGNHSAALIRFHVELDGKSVWTKAGFKSHAVDVDVSGAANLTLRTTTTSGEIDHWGWWGGARLTSQRALFPSCNKHCEKPVSKEAFRLSCYFRLCPGHCTSTNKKPYVYVDFRSEICFNPERRGSRFRSMELFSMSVGSTVTFDLKAFHQTHAGRWVFTATLATDLDSCKGENATNILNATVVRVYLDNKKVYSNNVIAQKSLLHLDSGHAQVVIPIFYKHRELRIEVTKHGSSNCKAVKWRNARLKLAHPLPSFIPCDAPCRETIFKRRIIPLSCFLNTCGAEVANKSNPPYFFLQSHHDGGMAINRSNSRPSDDESIKLHAEETYQFSIKANPSNAMIFDLNAMRLRGMVFTHFKVELDVSRNSECRHEAGRVFLVYLDDIVTVDEMLGSFSADEKVSFIIDVAGIRYLKLVTFNSTQREDCSQAVWTVAELLSVVFVRLTGSEDDIGHY